MVEWRRRLDDFAAKGWRNVVELRKPPEVEYVGLVNRSDDADDRVVVHIVAALNDYVVTGGGQRVMRNDSSKESVILYEYWTLSKRDGRWIVLSIEQTGEGGHHLEADIIASPWADTERLRAEAVAERAAAEAAPPGVSPAELADLDFDGEARAAALDLALADGRFDPDLIEASVRRAVAAWAEAVDGPDAPLEAVARPSAVDELLHPRGDRSRLVVRGAARARRAHRVARRRRPAAGDRGRDRRPRAPLRRGPRHRGGARGQPERCGRPSPSAGRSRSTDRPSGRGGSPRRSAAATA